MPDNYLQFVERFKIIEALDTLEEFLKSSKFNNEVVGSIRYRLKALELIDEFKNDKEYIRKIFMDYKNATEEQIIAEYANKILITNYQDEDAIKRRLKYIIKRAYKFQHSEGAHFVGPEENELTDKPFAKPLMTINTFEYRNLYLNLIDESYKLQNKDKEFEDYAHYMREITISYFFNLRIYKNYEFLVELEKRAKLYDNQKGYGWFLDRIRWLKNQYLEYIGKPDNITDCIKRYNKIKERQYIEISNSRDLFHLLRNIFQNELNNWFVGEGKKLLEAFKHKDRAGETELQKLIKIEIENVLLSKGLRPNDINIYRESQLLDDKRSDFLIGYGFIRPVLVEVKLSDHPDMQQVNMSAKESYNNFTQYIKDFKVDYSIFLVYENQSRENSIWEDHFSKIQSVYGKIKNVDVIGIPMTN